MQKTFNLFFKRLSILRSCHSQRWNAFVVAKDLNICRGSMVVAPSGVYCVYSKNRPLSVAWLLFQNYFDVKSYRAFCGCSECIRTTLLNALRMLWKWSIDWCKRRMRVDQLRKVFLRVRKWSLLQIVFVFLVLAMDFMPYCISASSGTLYINCLLLKGMTKAICYTLAAWSTILREVEVLLIL